MCHVGQSFTDLDEALNYAVVGGYRICEADIRVALQMSQEMGYHWGKVDAEEVLSFIAKAVAAVE